MKNHPITCLRIVRSLACCVFLALLTGGVVQGQVGEPEVSSGKVFRVTSLNEWSGPDLFVRSKDSEYVAMKPHQMAYTQPYPYLSGEPIILYTRKGMPDGTFSYSPLLRLSVPPKIRQPMMVVHWNDARKKASAALVEFSPDVFPFGSYQIVNMSKQPVVGTIGDTKDRYLCAPGKEVIIKPKLANGHRTPITVHAKIEDETKLVFSTMTIHRSRKRVIIFLVRSTNKLGRPIYEAQNLVDFAPQPEDEE